MLFISEYNRRTLKRVLLLLKPHTKKIIIIMVCMLLMAFIRVIFPLVTRQLIDNGFVAGNFNVVVELSAAGFILILIEQGIKVAEAKYRIYINSIVPFTLSKDALKKIFKLKLQFFNNTNVGEIINNINMDVHNTSAISDERIFILITYVFSIAGGLTGLTIISWKLTILVLLLVPVRIMLIRCVSKKKRYLFEYNMEKYKTFWGWYSDIIEGIKEIKLWSMERIMTGIFIKKQREIIKANAKIIFLDKINQISDSVTTFMTTALLYLAGSVLISGGNLTLGGLFAFLTYINFVISPIFILLDTGGYGFSTILPSAGRLFDFLDMECEYDSAGSGLCRLEERCVRGDIRFENVSFSYNNEKILDNISFEVQKGEKIALTGANGSGKTTIINLLLRFYKPDSGRILLDGTDISTINLKDYRQCISVICQDIYLFDASVYDNIALFKKMDGNTVFNAARQGAADEFIKKMSLKYDTMVGKNGSQLSGGEKQKIAVSRAFAKKSAVLVMDEATSNFDAESDIIVNRILESEFNDVTAIVITHKPDILKKVNKVLALDKGNITVHKV